MTSEKTFTDQGLTGANRARPGLREALAACRDGDTLVVTKLARLARSLIGHRACFSAEALVCGELFCPRFRSLAVDEVRPIVVVEVRVRPHVAFIRQETVIVETDVRLRISVKYFFGEHRPSQFGGGAEVCRCVGGQYVVDDVFTICCVVKERRIGGTGTFRGRIPFAPAPQVTGLNVRNHVAVVIKHGGNSINVVDLEGFGGSSDIRWGVKRQG